MTASIRNALARVLEALAAWSEERARRLKTCKTCGRSLFYAPGCGGAYLAGCRPDR